MENEDIKIPLTKDEALILSDFLSRFNKSANKEVFEDQAEQKVLWILEAKLEEILVEPFMSNYTDIINDARSRLRENE